MAVTFDPERQRMAKEYGRRARRLGLLLTALGLAALALFLLSGLSKALADFARARAPGPGGSVALYFLVGYALAALARLPAGAWYEAREREYGLSVRPWRAWAFDEAKGHALALPLGLGAVEALFWALRTFPTAWWLVVGALALAFNLLVGYLAPILLLPLFHRVAPLEEGEVRRRAEALAARAGVPFVGVYRLEAGGKTRRAMAALAGLGRTRRILVSDTLLEEYTPDEAEAVLAHELGHHVHGDALWGFLFSAAAGLGILGLLQLLLGPVAAALGLAPTDIALLPAILLLLGLFRFALAPVGNLLSRRREAAADAFALRLTGKPEAFASSMVKIHDRNLADATPHPLVEALFHTHPAGRRRVEAALGPLRRKEGGGPAP